jgi:hypothetical protein
LKKTRGLFCQSLENEKLKEDLAGKFPLMGIVSGIRLERAIILPEIEDQRLQGRKMCNVAKRFHKACSIISSRRIIG